MKNKLLIFSIIMIMSFSMVLSPLLKDLHFEKTKEYKNSPSVVQKVFNDKDNNNNENNNNEIINNNENNEDENYNKNADENINDNLKENQSNAQNVNNNEKANDNLNENESNSQNNNNKKLDDTPNQTFDKNDDSNVKDIQNSDDDYLNKNIDELTDSSNEFAISSKENKIKSIDNSIEKLDENIRGNDNNKVKKNIDIEELANPLTHYTSAKGMAVMEANSKRILFNKNGNTKLKMASTTKIVTAITVIENCKNLDEPFIISDKAIGIEGTSIYLQKGEKLTARELLYGLMLRSGNDASVALSLHVSKSIPEFCKLMKETAEKAGAYDSNFTNPHGLDNDDHYTTAIDLAKITAYALLNDTFKEIVSTKSIKISGANNTTRYLVNKNRLLNSLDDCVGVKTGFTKGAGRCLVSAIQKDKAIYVCVVLNCGPMFEESAEMLEYASENTSLEEIMPPYNFIRSIDVEDGVKSKVKLYCSNGYSFLICENERANINIEYEIPTKLVAPIVAETPVGKAYIYLDDKLLQIIDILTMEDIENDNMTDKIKDIIEKW